MALHPIIAPKNNSGFAPQYEIEGKKFLPRAFAYIIDSAFLWGLNVGTGYITGLILGTDMVTLVGMMYGKGFSFPGTSGITLNVWLGIGLTVAYFTLFERLYGCTLGKLILGMRVATLIGISPSTRQVLVRSLYRLFDGLFFGLVAAFQMEPPYFQRIGDKQTHTIVVSKSSPLVKDIAPWWYFFVAMGSYVVIVSSLRLISSF